MSKDDDINYMLLVSLMAFSIPKIVESLIETGQELSTAKITEELNKISTKFQFENVMVQTFIENLQGNAQSEMAMKMLGIFLVLQNTINQGHWIKLNVLNKGKDLFGSITSKIARGKLKGILQQDKTSRALVMQQSINNRVQTWGLSNGMTNTIVSGSSLMNMSHVAKNEALKNQNPNDAIKGLYTVAGYGKVGQ